jgi:signal transduction histidine kinase
MFENNPYPGTLQPKELEAVYSISRTVARAVDTDHALDDIVRLVRPVFIFDNMVLYVQSGDDSPEPTFARAIGRGRFREAELAWGESIASEAFQSGQTIMRMEKLPESGADRTGERYFLGLPLSLGDQMVGALVFVRFGGPEYTPPQVHLAEFIAAHVAQLLGRRQLVDRIATLEARRQLDNLQDNFVATISHELLTPLGFIKGYATTLLREDTTWDENTRREFLTIIDEEADRLRELIDNLMDSSRLQAGTLRINFQPLRLDTLLRDISLRARTRDENLVLRLHLNARGLQIQGDPTRLAQVFENLLSNASKYAPGSPVTISLDVHQGMARIAVRDEGPGIPAHHLDKLFKRFYRATEKNVSVRGTGLGLYICRQIVQAHHGEITVESKVGVGTVFYILLPYERVQGESN